jgi:hypothetical protein
MEIYELKPPKGSRKRERGSVGEQVQDGERHQAEEPRGRTHVPVEE